MAVGTGLRLSVTHTHIDSPPKPTPKKQLLRRTKGRKALLARVAKQDAETARLLDLPASTIKLPANVPRVKGIDRPLLPRGVTEAGLLPSRWVCGVFV